MSSSPLQNRFQCGAAGRIPRAGWWMGGLWLLALGAGAQSFEGLGTLDPTLALSYSETYGVSRDGSTVVGRWLPNQDPNLEVAFQWRPNTGMTRMNFPALSRSVARDVSANGTNVLVAGNGQFYYLRSPAGTRWIGDLGRTGRGNALSGDGRSVVGELNTAATLPPVYQAFVWTLESGIQGLDFTAAHDVSDDAGVIVGTLSVPQDNGGTETKPYAWRNGSGQVLAPESTSGSASVVSPDGTTIAGVYSVRQPGIGVVPHTYYSFRYRTSLEILEMAENNGHVFIPAGASQDGSVLVGGRVFEGYLPIASRAVIWTEESGFRAIQDILEDDLGLDLGGWHLMQAVDVSGDGRVIVGSGWNPKGEVEAWRAVLRPDPTKIVVNSTADRGRREGADCCDTGEVLPNGDPECTLRAAIEAVNAGCDGVVEFNVPGTAVPRIAPATPLPTITRPVVLDATTQPGGGKVELVGSNLSGAVGLDVAGGNSVVRGFLFNEFSDSDEVPLLLREKGGNRVAGNHFGTDATGNEVRPSAFGLWISGSPNNVIGGAAEDDANVFNGERSMIFISGAGATGNRVQGNLIGLGKSGLSLSTPQLGVLVTGGANNTIGGPGPLGNRIFSKQAGIRVEATEPIDGLLLEGNQIGLDAAGTPVNGTIGIMVRSEGGPAVTGARIIGNRVAGYSADIVVAGKDAKDTVVENNVTGLRFDGSGLTPAGLDADKDYFGIRVDGAPGTKVIGNTAAGHTYDLLVAGNEQFYSFGESIVLLSPDTSSEGPEPGAAAGGVVVEGNRVGLNEVGSVPAGAVPLIGIAVFAAAESVTLRNNVVAGHTEKELWLVDGSGHTVAGNRLGTLDGVDRGSQRGLVVTAATNVLVGPAGIFPGNVIGRNAQAGIDLDGPARNVTIRGNVIGADPEGNFAWPNGVGIRTIRVEDGDSASGLVIADNTIGGNTGHGVDLDLPNLTTIRDNRIGVTPNGLSLPNATGVRLKDTPAELLRNTIAHNASFGIDIDGSGPTRIEAGPIYANGDGQATAGIAYETPPFPPPTRLLALRTAETNGQVSVVFGAITGGTAGMDEIEIYGNRAGETQGRVPLVRRTVPADRPYLERFDVSSTSAFATSEGFTATVTRGGSTSTFGMAVPPASFSFPEIESSPVSEGELTLRWPDESGRFVLEAAPSATGPWDEVPLTPAVTDGIAELRLAVGEGARFYRLNVKI